MRASVVDETGFEAADLLFLSGDRYIEQIDVNLVGPVGPGDLVLVHAGAAIAVVEADAP